MRARVLVVDDNAENRALAQATLEDDDYEVVVAHDGASSIAAFEASQPDCILLDIQMPGLDGIRVCERIRALAGGSAVAILFVTAQRDLATFDRALAAGGDDFITKPFRPSELVVRVETALRLRKLTGERSELYAEVKRQRDDLQRLQLQKDQLASFVVHDLKNPVNAIQLQAERLLRDPAATERTRSAGTAIRGEARGLMRMLLDLLDMSRADEGRLIVSRARVPLADELAAVREELALVAAGAEVTLVQEVSAELELHADRDVLHRILINLVENAIRHAPERSEVRISAAGNSAGVELRITDAGSGVPAEQRAHVFDRFVSGGGTRNRGLGLSFCKLAVEAHGGQIWIEDASPGAVFCMRFPDVTA
ncbi:MAG: hybrid sensor histidine kinase/response regulator [Kofleriaceae bacterium]|nr:hybrid sensor histidine kinase/response regulator [Kofleriaceae bacterium]